MCFLFPCHPHFCFVLDVNPSIFKPHRQKGRICFTYFLNNSSQTIHTSPHHPQAPMAAPLYRREGSLDFTRTPSSSTMPVVLPPGDDRQHQHQQQERLLKGSHNKEQSQVPTPESRALYAACSEGAGLAKVGGWVCCLGFGDFGVVSRPALLITHTESPCTPVDPRSRPSWPRAPTPIGTTTRRAGRRPCTQPAGTRGPRRRASWRR